MKLNDYDLKIYEALKVATTDLDDNFEMSLNEDEKY